MRCSCNILQMSDLPPPYVDGDFADRLARTAEQKAFEGRQALLIRAEDVALNAMALAAQRGETTVELDLVNDLPDLCDRTLWEGPTSVARFRYASDRVKLVSLLHPRTRQFLGVEIHFGVEAVARIRAEIRKQDAWRCVIQ